MNPLETCYINTTLRHLDRKEKKKTGGIKNLRGFKKKGFGGLHTVRSTFKREIDGPQDIFPIFYYLDLSF